MNNNKIYNGIENDFTSHELGWPDISKCNEIRDELKDAAHLIDDLVPDCTEKNIAITKIEEAMFWANAGISRYPTNSKIDLTEVLK